jgi:hypothetical protein
MTLYCEEHPDRIAISRVNLRGIQQRRCAECHDRDVRMQRVELIEAGYETMKHAIYWKRIDHSDPRALEMADRHYSRQSPGTPEFTPSGNKVVLMHFLDDDTPAALWASHRPEPGKAVRADGRDAWACTMFRVEHRTVVASDLIREAVAITKALWQPLPADGFYTTINPRKVAPIKQRGRAVWGYCYIKAGWRVLEERTKVRDLIILQMPADDLAQAEPIQVSTATPPFGTAWRRWAKAIPEGQLSLFDTNRAA